MPWLGKGRGDVPRAWAAALEQVLQAVDATRQVAKFVLTGQHAEALKTVKSRHPWVQGNGRWNSDAAKRAMATLYAGFGDVDAAVLRRWGRVLDATWTAGWGLTLGDVAGCHWPELMLKQAAACVPSAPLPFTFADLERIAAEDGTPPADLVRMVFTLAPYSRYQGPTVRGYLSRLPGFADAVAAHRDVAASTLVSGSVEERVAAASLLGMLGDTVLGALAEPLGEAATSTSAQVRDAVRPLIARIDGAAVGPLRRLATDGKPDRRVYALELLAARPDQRAWAIQTAGADRAATVRALSARWAAADMPAATIEEPPPEPPPLLSWSLAAADAERVATKIFEAVRRVVESHNRRMEAGRQQYPKHHLFREISEPPRSTVGRLARLLAADDPARVDDKLDGIPASGLIASEIADAIHEEGYSATTAIQVMAALGWLDLLQHNYRPWVEVIDEVHARTGGLDLLTMQRMFDAVGLDGRALVWSSYSASWGSRLGRDWPGDHVWPFVAHNLDWILEESSSRHGWGIDEHALFAAIATLPRPPARLVDRLYTLAIGARKSDRAPAQAAVERDPQRTARAAAALQDGKSDVRLATAQWLTRIADPSALPALQTAWKKEKLDVVRGALLDALIAVGEDAGTYLDPATTVATAAKFVAKGLPSSLGWLDWEVLPELTWASSGKTVARAVVQWLCGTAVKAKSPEPDAVLRHYAALFDAAARERLATHLLAGWLREDLRTISPAEAESRAAQAASRYHRWYSAQNGPYAGMSVEQVQAALLPTYVKVPAGSAIASKGLLAVVAACAGRDVVPPAERYLREWYGQRAAQGKALIAMLAWVHHPSATQLVLAIGSRFRTKSFQEEAVRQAGALAGRRGWTVDELADRTIPTAGFDDDGVLELPYGPRTFTAVLRPDLTVELRDPDGKVIKALPAPRQSDDAERAKESKKTFSAAKRELKSIATLQAQRLYEAMCTERSWSAEDWHRYLLRHPVVGPAVRRLVWVAPSDHGGSMVFRPLDDGSLTDVDDNDVDLPDGARVKVAHDSVLSPDEIAQWSAHLADYEVTPLFQQLGRGVHAITPEMRSKRELTDFTGCLLRAFALRGRVGKLGYTRGQSEDAGWFYTYEKHFPTLGIVATVNFTGNPLPEENRLVALKELSFRRETSDGRRAELTLGDVPAVLLSECWHDMRLLAAEGTGFDPEWEKKTEF
jgi:Domain of unknown function (DUF4132)